MNGSSQSRFFVFVCMALAPGDCLVQVQEDAGDGRPCRQFGRVEVGRDRASPLPSKAPGLGRSSRVLVVVSVEQASKHGRLVRPHGPGKDQFKCALSLARGSAPPSRINRPARARAASIYVGSFKSTSPGGACSNAVAGPRTPCASRHRTRASSGAKRYAASKCRERGDTGSHPGRPGSCAGKIEENPVSRRLIRFDAWPADLERKQSAGGECTVANELGVRGGIGSDATRTGWPGCAGVYRRVSPMTGGMSPVMTIRLSMALMSQPPSTNSQASQSSSSGCEGHAP